MVFNVVLVYAIQESTSVKCAHIAPPFGVSFPLRSPQSTEESPPSSTAGSHYLPVLYTVECACQSRSPSSSHLLAPFGVPTFLFYVCVSISVLQIRSSILLYILCRGKAWL